MSECEVTFRRKRKGKKRFRKVSPPFILNPKDELKISIYNPTNVEQKPIISLSGIIIKDRKGRQK